jgi:putative sterol carrier protein
MFSTSFCGKVRYNNTMSIETVKFALQQKLASAPQIGAKIRFDLGDEGIFGVDGTVSPPVLTDGEGEADTTFICPSSVLLAIMDGSQDPTMAYMMGKLKVQGSLGYAMKINSFLGD